jgi:hypothetical protein
VSPVSEPLPLAAASIRLRRRPGRPPLAPEEKARRAAAREARRAAALAAVPPRLLTIQAAAKFLSLSVWTVRALVENGTLPRVVVPIDDRSDLRRILIDREDLERLIRNAKGQA